MSDSTLLDFQDRLGLFLTVLGACISLICVTGILLYALYNSRRRVRRQDASDSSIFLNLMFADLIQATGIMFNIKWVDDGIVSEGGLCTAQAVVKQIGINGVSATSLAITIHTFLVLVLCWNPPRNIAIPIISIIWIFTALVVGIPNAVHKHDVYYGQTGFWCWILPKYQAEQLLSEYLWVWITGLSMFLLYLIMYLVLGGWVIIDNGIHWRWNYTPPDFVTPRTAEEMQENAKARKLLYYPAVYIFCVLPNSIARWLTFTGHNPPHRFILFANTIYALSGFFNFLVFYLTRKAMVIGEQVRGHDNGETVPRGNRAVGFLPPDQPDMQNGHAPDIPLSAIDGRLGGSPMRQQGEMEGQGRGFLPR